MTAKQRPKKEELKTLQMEVHGNTRNGAPRLPLCRENVTSKSLLILVLYKLILVPTYRRKVINHDIVLVLKLALSLFQSVYVITDRGFD